MRAHASYCKKIIENKPTYVEILMLGIFHITSEANNNPYWMTTKRVLFVGIIQQKFSTSLFMTETCCVDNVFVTSYTCHRAS